MALADIRDALPEAVQTLLDRHPRESWPETAGQGPWTQFWMERHATFRQLSAMMANGFAQARDGAVDAASFKPWFAQRANYFLQNLDLHHRVEEFHIFPACVCAEPDYQPAMALLEHDHEAIHAGLEALHGAAVALLAVADDDGAAFLAHIDTTAAALADLAGGLIGHLDDEEDLIMALVQERGEGFLPH